MGLVNYKYKSRREWTTGMSKREMWDTVKRSCIHLGGVSKREFKENETKAINI